MKAVFLPGLALMMFSSTSYASSEAITVEVTDRADRVEVIVRNQSDHVHLVNRRLSVGLIDRGADIEFIIRPAYSDAQVGITAIVEPWPLEDADKALLRPDELVGVAIRKCFIAQLYSLIPGAYLLKVRYAPVVAWEPFTKTAGAESKETKVSFDATTAEPSSCFGTSSKSEP